MKIWQSRLQILLHKCCRHGFLTSASTGRGQKHTLESSFREDFIFWKPLSESSWFEIEMSFMSYSIFKDVCVASIHFHTLDELTSRHFNNVRHLFRRWTCLSSGLFLSHLQSRGCLYPCRGRRRVSDPALHLVVPRAVPFNWSHHSMFWHWLNCEFFFWNCHRLLYLCW